jgi:hypothetical protein
MFCIALKECISLDGSCYHGDDSDDDDNDGDHNDHDSIHCPSGTVGLFDSIFTVFFYCM